MHLNRSRFANYNLVRRHFLTEIDWSALLVMNHTGQNCIIPALLWYPSLTPESTLSCEDAVSFVSFGYRVESQCTPSYLFPSPTSRPSVIESQRSPSKSAKPPTDHEPTGFYAVHGKSHVAKDPFAPECLIPMPKIHGDQLLYYEPVFVRRRNERERQRVRCVNEGYSRLRQRLPAGSVQKRMSKVDILKSAIRYIRHLQTILDVGCNTANDSRTKLDSKPTARGSRPG